MFFTIKRTTIIVVAIMLIAIIVSGVVYFEVDKAAAAKTQKLLPIYSVETDKNIVALSFDAAWGADKTRGIMDMCDSYGVKATFFLVGFWIDEHADLVKEIYDRGFLIGNHSAYHPHMNSLTEDKQKEEISTVNDKIQAITGQSTAYFRAPFGEYNNSLIKVVEEMNMQAIQWDVDTLDWKGISGTEIASRVLGKVKSGSIVLMHNNSDHVLDALPLILSGLKEKSLTAVTMDQLVYRENYTIDNNGQQKNNKN